MEPIIDRSFMQKTQDFCFFFKISNTHYETYDFQ